MDCNFYFFALSPKFCNQIIDSRSAEHIQISSKVIQTDFISPPSNSTLCRNLTELNHPAWSIPTQRGYHNRWSAASIQAFVLSIRISFPPRHRVIKCNRN
ncbi:hypothetical protein XFF6970_60002 [Xanthomonas citri pv. fuscans]|nr:hypothetical protein XFF6970_60002 [Xanthomonas citri pv. fuscans]